LEVFLILVKSIIAKVTDQKVLRDFQYAKQVIDSNY